MSIEESKKKYSKKLIRFTVEYSLKDIEEGKRLKEYLELTGQSGNSYLKALIKKDLDEKGV